MAEELSAWNEDVEATPKRSLERTLLDSGPGMWLCN